MPPRCLRRSARKVYSNKYRTANSDDDDCVVITEIKHDERCEDSEPQSDPIIEEEEEEPEPIPVPKPKAPAKRQRRSTRTKSQKRVFEDEDPCLSASILPCEETPFQEVALAIEEVEVPSNDFDVRIEEIFHGSQEHDTATAEHEHDDDDPYRLIAVNGIHMPQILLKNLNLDNLESSAEPEDTKGKENLDKVDPRRDDAKPMLQGSGDEIQFKKELLATRDCLIAKMKTAALSGCTFVDARGITCDFRSAQSLESYLNDAAAYAPSRLEEPRVIRAFLGENVNSDSAEVSADGTTNEVSSDSETNSAECRAALSSCAQV